MLYGQYSNLAFDDNLFWALKVVAIIIAKYKRIISNIWNGLLIANKTLLEKTIKANKVYKKRVENVVCQFISIE